jgi:hypothetical protein
VAGKKKNFRFPQDGFWHSPNFVHRLRIFLHFREMAAKKIGLEPQQHQLLLQIAGAPDDQPPTVRYVAERLGLRHNTGCGVELSMREGWINHPQRELARPAVCRAWSMERASSIPFTL